MGKKDIIYAAICGLSVAWIASDFLPEYGLIFFIALPIFSVIGLTLADLIGRRTLVVRQIGKFFLTGAFASAVDVRIFQFLFWLVPFSLFFKGISFLLATFAKFWLSKHWAFEKHEKNNIKKEITAFLAVNIAALAVNVGAFYFFTKMLGPKLLIETKIWAELSIIFSAFISASVNFLGYKFIVFKK